MNFLLDTNVVSEWVRPHPDPNVISWLAEVDEDRVFISVISFAEIRRGVEMLPAGRRRERLATWLAEDLPARFEERILDIDPQRCRDLGRGHGAGAEDGLTLGSMDAFVAATAEAHGLTLATRNVKDFQRLGISLLDPWQPDWNGGAQWFRRTLAGATGSSRIFFFAVCFTGECLGVGATSATNTPLLWNLGEVRDI